MNYITTNIRIPEDDYLQLKQEAAKKRKSLAEVIREKLTTHTKKRSKVEIDQMMREIDETAKTLGKKLKGFNSVKALREMRYEGK